MSNQANNGEHDEFTVLPPQDENPKVENIKRLEDGPNPCILYSIIQLGKHYSEYKGVKSDYASPMVLLTKSTPPPALISNAALYKVNFISCC